jgi:cytochrome o ubiquinol oxidase operon protein cyoD
MNRQPNNLRARNYVVGFGLSLALTLVSYFLVRKHVNAHHLIFTDSFILVAISLLAITQLFVQLVFFLHLDSESKPWWNNTALAFAVTVVITIVFGSIWIMANLSYHHGAHSYTHSGHPLTTPGQTTKYIIQDENFHY